MTDLKELQTRFRDLSSDVQKTLEDAVDEWAREGKGQLRESLGAPNAGAVWAAFIGGIVLGAVVGGLVALLVAPRSGPELRDEITERTRRSNGMTREAASASARPSAT